MQISQESTCVVVFINKVAGPQNCNFIKKGLQHRFSPGKFAKLLRTPCFTEHLQWLLLTVSGFQTGPLLKKRLQQRSFLLIEHLRMTTSCVYLWILTSFLEHFFYRGPLGNCFFHVQVAEFQPPDAVKNYFTGVFQAFYTRTRRSHSNAFIYLKFLKTIWEEVNL